MRHSESVVENASKTIKLTGRRGESGAALIMVLLATSLVAVIIGVLFLPATLAAISQIEATTQEQAYDAAEAGMAAALNVLRGNADAPVASFTEVSNPFAHPYYSYDSSGRLSGWGCSGTNPTTFAQWLQYDATYTDRVPLTANYTPQSGIAYRVDATPIRFSEYVLVSTEIHIYDSSNNEIGSRDPGNPNRVVVTFDEGNGNSLTLDMQDQIGTTGARGCNGGGTMLPVDYFYTLYSTTGNGAQIPSGTKILVTLHQSVPSKENLTIEGTLTGAIAGGQNTVKATFGVQRFNIGEARYTITPVTNFASPPPAGYAANSSLVFGTVTLPSPVRIQLRATGYGPRGAKRVLETICDRTGINWHNTSALLMRGADDDLPMSLVLGNSASNLYSGYDRANGATSVPVFGVTRSSDVTAAQAAITSAPQTRVTSATANIRQVPSEEIPLFLRSADGAIDMRSELQKTAKNMARYFGTGFTGSAGTNQKPLFTFVDGNCNLSGGAGLLVVTGELHIQTGTTFNGLILVLGGIVNASGAANVYGAMAVARVQTINNKASFLAPSFSMPNGAVVVEYDSTAITTALDTLGFRIIGIKEN